MQEQDLMVCIQLHQLPRRDQRLGSHRLLFGVFRSWWSGMVQLETLTADQLHAAQNAGLLPFTAASATQYQNVSSIDDLGFNAGWEGALSQSRLRYAVNVTGTYARLSDAGGATGYADYPMAT